MLFNSVEFLFVFLPATVALYYAARRAAGHTAALGVLALASLVFYAWWDIRAVPLLLGSIAVNYALGLALERRPGRALLALGIVINLGVLGFFKYAGFFAANVKALSGQTIPLGAVILPLGISFYTFEQITFLTDVWRGRTKPGTPLAYGLFVGFFPHLIAGPIVQHRDLGAQLADPRPRDAWSDLGVGLSVFAVGLAKKVLLAESFATYASAAFDAADRGQAVALGAAWVAALAYTLQIFFDFAGYSDMALGLARMFGYRLPINFNAPYRSVSIIEFWRRWHVTLSQFLRDYLYIPLGGNRLGKARRYANLMATMLIGGLWHGASWTFVVWGGLHGFYLVVAHLWTERFGTENPGRLRRAAGWFLTFFAVVVAWVLFRAKTFDGAGLMLRCMAGLEGTRWSVDGEALRFLVLGLAIVLLLPDTPDIFASVVKVPDKATPEPEAAPHRRWLAWRPTRPWAWGAALLLFVSALFLSKTSEFIYYNF
jgi:D-alanyl-lipoteichoic acid acyltransferase DltB (MBOAT superfamily)